MKIFAYILTALSYGVLGAHFFRNGEYGLVLVSVVLPLLLFTKKRAVLYIVSGCLALGSLEWLSTASSLYQLRQIMGQPASRMLIILSTVGAITLLAGLVLHSDSVKKNYNETKHDLAAVSAFFLTALLLGFASIKTDVPILLLERFIPTSGWVEIFLLSLYASFITKKMLDTNKSDLWRKRIWTLFSVVFFAQLILGLLGYETFWMTGNLHIPVPAIILAGPLYRWELSFMVFLFLGSLIVSGPAWCSYLCYFGVLDNHASTAKKHPGFFTKYLWHIRIGLFLLFALTAITLNFAGVSAVTAGVIGILAGAVGIAVIIVFSRKLGFMAHCNLYCPIGLAAVVLGRISPFRIKINDDCTSCMKCRYKCRYNALNFDDIKKGKPNLNCTLCGDCIPVCDADSINYRFLKLSPEKARILFIVIIVSLHAVFLGVGRI